METLERLINEKQRGGKHRRQILQYLENYPKATPYQIAKAIYRNVQAGYKITKKHLTDFEKLGVIRLETKGKISHYFFTERGRMLCKTAGLILPSTRAEEIIMGLNRYVRGPLTNGDVKKLRALLTDDVIDTMEEIFKNFKWQKSADYWPKLTPPPKEVKKWFAPWFKFVKALEKKNLKKRKYIRIERPSLPNLFIISMAVLRWEFGFNEFQQKQMGEYGEFFENAAKKYAKSNKVPLKVVRNRLRRMYLEQQSREPDPYGNYFVWRDFEKISCGHYLIQGNPKISDNFIKLDEWLVGSFFKKCGPLVLDYVLRIGDELVRQLGLYGWMWARHELSKKSRSRKKGEKEKEGGGEKA